MRELELKNFCNDDIKKELTERFGFSDEAKIDTPLFNIFALMEKEGCTDVIVEDRYIDKEYLDEFSRYYSTVFKNYEKCCVRLHFFKDNIRKNVFGFDDDNVKLFFDRSFTEQLQDQYLGFCVIRPLERNRVSRTVIKPYIENVNEEFILSQSEATVNLNGTNLKAHGMPFLQQDAQSGVCANASLVMLSQYMHEKYKYQTCTAPEATIMANDYFGFQRAFPNKGLRIEQIVGVLIKLGYSPVVYSAGKTDPAEREKLKKIVYYYLESELPVILIINIGGIILHSCLIIGHDYKVTSKTVISHPRRTSDFIQHFYLQDDQLGPYLKMPIRSSDVKTSGYLSNNNNQSLFNQFYSTPYSFENVVAAIVPIHKKIYLMGEEVETHVEALLRLQSPTLRTMMSYMDKDDADSLAKAINNNEISIRTYFIKSNEYKNRMANIENASPSLKRIYLNAELPNYIWITEISTFSFVSSAKSEDHMVFGEIICDATLIQGAPIFFRLFHIPGVLVDANPNVPGDIKILKIIDDKQYQAYIR